MTKQSLLPFPGRTLARSLSTEWLGGCFTSPSPVLVGGEPVRPEVILWLELPSGLLVSATPVDPTSPISFGASLEATMRAPAEGPPRRPSRVRVARRALAREIEALEHPPRVVVAPTPELDAIFGELVESLPSSETPTITSYLEGGATVETVRRSFEAANRFHRRRPWLTIAEPQVIGADIPRLDVRGLCLCVIGGGGEPGLLVFSSLEEYVRFTTAPPDPSALPAGPIRRDGETSFLSVSFDPKRRLPSSMVKEIESYRWPINRRAVPVFFRADPDGIPHPMTDREVRTVTACVEGLLAFLDRHEPMFADADSAVVQERLTVSDGLTITLTAPVLGDILMELPEAESFEPEELSSNAAAMRVGRNDPCPCGSGRKFKKCHLGAQESFSENPAPPPATKPLHDMDFELVRELHAFAEKRWGRLAPVRWRPSEWDSCPERTQLEVPWRAYHSVIEGRSLPDWFIEEHEGDLSRREIAWIRAQLRTWLSIWEVTDVAPGRIDLRDLLTGERRGVEEVAASKTVLRRDALLARVLEFEEHALLAGLHGRALPPIDAARVVDVIRSTLKVRAKHVEPFRLRDIDIGEDMIELWEDEVRLLDERRSIPPRLQNTDGHPLLFVTDSFEFAADDRERLEGLVAAMDGAEERFDREDESGERRYAITKPGNAQYPDWDNTVIGDVGIGDGTLRVETNSKKRGTALRRRLEKACGDRIRFREREMTDPRKALRSGGVEHAPRERSPEEDRIELELKQRQYEVWPDQSIPALAGMTPREAARNAATRRNLDLLLRQMEHQEYRLPESRRFDFRPLRRELGLED